jgi:SPP1 gp7 family putative phage head morphogenesis protein
MKSPYLKTDKVIAYLSNQYAKLFRRVTSFDELNVISVSHEIYDEALKVTEREATRLVKSVYDSYSESAEISESDSHAAVVALMGAYNPTTKYIYRNELDRKRSRFAEGVISSDTPREEVELAKRLLVGMNKQFADDATFEAVVKAYADDGVKKVRWITAVDDRRCKECKARHGKVYDIDNIPPKPHLHCRCYVEKVEEKQQEVVDE